MKTSFVFRPGAGHHDNVYGSWPDLIAAVNAVSGPRSIFVDGSFAAPHVPAGTWAVDSCTITCRVAPTGFADTLVFDDGAKLTFNSLWLVQASLQSDSTTPVCSFSAGRGGLVACVFVQLYSSSGKAPFIQVAGDAGAFTILGIHEILLGDGTTPALQCDAPKEIEFQLSNHSILFSNATAGTGTIDLEFDGDSLIEAPQAPGIVLFPQSQAGQTTYAPAAVANWSGTAPSSVANALDRIAAKIGPIP